MREASVDLILVVTSLPKLQAIATHIGGRYPVKYAIQRDTRDAWGAIRESFDIPAELTLYAMPDTIFPRDAFRRPLLAEFNMGLFRTEKSERFGMVNGAGIITDKKEGKSGLAWGLLAWSGQVQSYWRREDSNIQTHTQAFNMATAHYGFDMFELEFYADMASWEDYQKAVANGIALI